MKKSRKIHTEPVIGKCAMWGMVILAAWCFPAQSWAGAQPSPEVCSAMGYIEGKCVICATGDYKGKISVEAKYLSSASNCSAYLSEARTICSRAYNIPHQEVGVQLNYTVGTTNHTSSLPRKEVCKY